MISTHLQPKPWQVAVSHDPNLPIRKWNHVGTHWHPSAPSAAITVGGGNIINVFSKEHKAVYELDTGEFIAIS